MEGTAAIVQLESRIKKAVSLFVGSVVIILQHLYNTWLAIMVLKAERNSNS